MKSQYCWSHFRNYGDFQTLWELPTFTFATWIIRSLNGLLPLLYRFVWTCDFFKLLFRVSNDFIYMISKAMSKQAQSTYFILEKNELSYLKKEIINGSNNVKSSKMNFLISKKKILTYQYYTKKKKTAKSQWQT